jgi:Na+/melibiose symporter-like transporter
VSALGGRFWRLYASSATSNLADGIGRTALPLFAASLTRDPVAIAGLTSFAFLPWLLFALPSGALVDRVDRRHAMSAANGVRAVAIGLLAVLAATGTASVVALYAVAFALGVAETVYDSATRALLPQVVSRGQLDRANGLLTVEETLGQQFIGAPVGAALFAFAVALPFGLNAAGFALAAVVVLSLPGRYRPARPTERRSVARDVADGVRWLARHGLLRGLSLISAATSFTEAMATGVLVLYVLDVLGLPPERFGLFLVTAGVGALAGAAVTPPLARVLGRGPLLTAGAALTAVATAAMAATDSGGTAGLLFALASAGVMVWNVLTMSLRQSLIPEEMFGRVQGAYRTLVWGGIPLGSLAGGAIADVLGVPAVFAVSGAGLLVLAGLLGLLLHRHAADLVDDGEDDGEPATAAPVSE